MNRTEIDAALIELDRLLNDLETPMNPDRVWDLLAEVSPRLRDELSVADKAFATRVALSEHPQAKH